MTDKDKEAPYGRYASGNPRPKPVKKKSGNIVWRAIHRWWLKAIERWRKGEVLVEKPASRRRQLRSHGVGLNNKHWWRQKSMSQQVKAEPSINWRFEIQPDGQREKVYYPIYDAPSHGKD